MACVYIPPPPQFSALSLAWRTVQGCAALACCAGFAALVSLLLALAFGKV